jgi:hypothetical protein
MTRRPMVVSGGEGLGVPASPSGCQASPSAADASSQSGIPNAWDTLVEAMRDPDYAWSWHCNLAVPIMDAIGVTHEQANVAAAYLMQHIWGCDITAHPNYQYEKSAAQAYAEIRIAADREEDARASRTESSQ